MLKHLWCKAILLFKHLVHKARLIINYSNILGAKQDFCSAIVGAKQDFCSNILGAKQDICSTIMDAKHYFFSNVCGAKQYFCSNIWSAKQNFCANILGAKQDFCWASTDRGAAPAEGRLYQIIPTKWAFFFWFPPLPRERHIYRLQSPCFHTSLCYAERRTPGRYVGFPT